MSWPDLQGQRCGWQHRGACRPSRRPWKCQERRGSQVLWAGKPKWRLTQDLSWPPPLTLPDNAGGFVCSHNDSMDRSRWPVNPLIRVRDLADAAAIMRASGAPVHLWSLDGQAFYRSVGRQRSELWRCAMPISDGFQVDERCCFGSAADATKCSRFSNLIVHAVRRRLMARIQIFDAQRSSAGLRRTSRERREASSGQKIPACLKNAHHGV